MRLVNEDNARLLLFKLFKSVRRSLPNFGERRPKQRDMTEADELMLKQKLNLSFIAAPENIKLMSRYTFRSREEFARRTKSMVLYLPEEAEKVKVSEEQAALRAAPQAHDLRTLNGLNIGCGDRKINDSLMPLDIMRATQLGKESGEHHAFLPHAFLSNPEDLPFKPESIDYIVALHMLEHVSNPIEVLLHWATILKPGGGIGLILPDYRYTWDASGDVSKFGHKWNSTVGIFQGLYDAHLREHFILECLGTVPYKISFDAVLRKRGTFSPFSISNRTCLSSGAELSLNQMMVSSPFQQQESS